ncbi:MAG: hypothetical protein WCL44_08200 [bacterium]
MTEQNDSGKAETGCCESGCSCGTAKTGGRGRYIVGIVILLVAGVLVVRAMVKDNGTATVPKSTGFAALPPAQVQASDPAAATKAPVTNTAKEIGALSELNAVAADSFGVFVYLPDKSETTWKAPMAQMEGAARTVEPQLKGGKISMFALKAGSPDYEQLAKQMTVPGVLAMVKGAGMSATSGDITENKLVQALVAASSAGGCGPASSGCGPSGCK